MSVVDCPYKDCTYTAKYKSIIKKHILIHTDSKPFKCDIIGCNFRTKTKDNLKAHKLVHTDSKPFKCDIIGCNYASKTKGDLKKHKLIHTDDSFICGVNGCNFKTKTRILLKQHKLIHTDSKPFVCKIDNCDFKTKRKEYLKRHEKSHIETELFKCKECNHKTKYKENLIKHILTVHSDERLFICSINNCTYRSKTNGDLRKHQSTVHSDERLFKCPINGCCHSSKTPNDLKKHLIIHGEKKFNCNVENCNFSTAHIRSLRLHKQIHNSTYQQRQKKKEQKVADFLTSKEMVYYREHCLQFGKCINSNEGSYCLIDYTCLNNMSTHMISIECDELQHKYNVLSCELRRMNDALTSVMTDSIKPLKGMHWIRFNPDSFKVDGETKRVPIKNRYERLYQIIKERQKTNMKDDFTITYMYYDTNDEKPAIFEDKEYPEWLKSKVINIVD